MSEEKVRFDRKDAVYTKLTEDWVDSMNTYTMYVNAEDDIRGYAETNEEVENHTRGSNEEFQVRFPSLKNSGISRCMVKVCSFYTQGGKAIPIGGSVGINSLEYPIILESSMGLPNSFTTTSQGGYNLGSIRRPILALLPTKTNTNSSGQFVDNWTDPAVPVVENPEINKYLGGPVFTDWTLCENPFDGREVKFRLLDPFNNGYATLTQDFAGTEPRTATQLELKIKLLPDYRSNNEWTF